MLKESQLFSLLDKALNQTAHIRKGEEAVYFCPFCTHYKKKLEVNVRTQEWHCWICNSCGKSIKSLFYKLKANESLFDELYKIIGREWVRNEKQEDRPQNLSLPSEFIPLWNKSSFFGYGHAMSYLEDRHITMDDIIRYNIGYCEYGIYRQRVVVPSYDKDGNLNFFAARSYLEGNTYKYMLPPWSKDIIGFELFINWLEPITIVESPFNAITIRNNTIPLFGKTLSNSLIMAIIENKVKKINVCLDNDAEEDSIKVCEKLINLGIDTYFVKLTKKDPNEIGFEKMVELIENAEKMDFSSIIRKKMEYI